jgi:hypothetical protein
MDEGNVGLLERPQEKGIINHPEELKQLRDDLRGLHDKGLEYGREEKKIWGDLLPKNHKELRDMLDAKVAEVSSNHEDKEEGRDKLPSFVLRQEDDWTEIGWSEESKRRVLDKLRTILGINDENARMRALESLVGAGVSPEQALEKITQERLDEMKAKAQHDADQANRGNHYDISSLDMELAQQTLLLSDIGVENNYIKRFILHDKYTKRALPFLEGFQRSLQEEFDGVLPDNLFDLAWKKELFGIDGKFPILQMQVENKKVDGKMVTSGRFVVNEANWIRWMRDHINWWYEEYDTDAVTDYFAKVEVKKGPFYSVNLITMLYGYNRYFRDETGHLWTRLYDQTLLEPWMMMFQRTYALGYDDASGDEEQLANKLKEMYHLNKLTRKIYGKSMMQLLSTSSVDYTGPDSDTKVGEAFQKMFLAYYNMADFEELQRVLGEDSTFFKKEGWNDALKDAMGDIAKQHHMLQMDRFLGDRQGDFFAAFDKDGKIKDKKKFINFINIFNDEPVSSTITMVLRQALMNAVSDSIVTDQMLLSSTHVDKSQLTKENKLVDTISLKYAWLLAHSWSYFSGGRARSNFPEVAGYLAETKWLYTDAYRMKYMQFGGAGNPYTVPMFKQLSIPLFEALLVENSFDDFVFSRDEEGNPEKMKTRQLTAMEIFMRMHEESEHYNKERKILQGRIDNASGAQKEALQKELEKLEDVAKNRYKLIAGELEFKENAMRVYAKNVVGRGKALYEQLMKSKETSFDKFITYDGLFRGPSFHREEWQSAIQDKYITPLRYLFEANKATQLNKITRAPVFVGNDEHGKPKWVWRDQYLGERMLGHQILDVEPFWQEIKDFGPEMWKDLKGRGYSKRGKYAIRPDGKHVIDYNKVQDNKKLVYKQWLLMKIAGDLWSHIDRHSTDPAYSLHHYDEIVESIAALPGNIDGTEYDLKGVRVNHTFFEKEQMQWLKRMSGADGLFLREFLHDVFQGDKRKKESLFGESTGIILGAIFKGY